MPPQGLTALWFHVQAAMRDAHESRIKSIANLQLEILRLYLGLPDRLLPQIPAFQSVAPLRAGHGCVAAGPDQSEAARGPGGAR